MNKPNSKASRWMGKPLRGNANQVASQTSSNGTAEVPLQSPQEWLAAVKRAAYAHGYMTGVATNFAQDMESYDEEDNHRMVPSSKSMHRLTLRFLNRLSTTFGDGGAWHSPTIGLIREDPEGSIIIIRMWRMSAAGERSDLRDIGSWFASAFLGIHASRYAKAHYEHLEHITFRLWKNRVQAAVTQLGGALSKHQNKIDDLIATMMGLHDEEPQARDTLVGDAVIALRGSMHALTAPSLPAKSSLDYEKRLKVLMLAACKLYYLEGGWVQERLRSTLGTSLANAIYDAVFVLSQPVRSVETFVRFAQAMRVFSRVEFKRGDPTSDDADAVSISTPALEGTCGHPVNSRSGEDHSSKDTYTNSAPDQSNTVLQQSERAAASYLQSCILQKCVPDPRSDAYYSFGFVACQSEDDILKLLNFYKDIFRRAAFREVCVALSKGRIPYLFQRYSSPAAIMGDIPQLGTFLSTPFDKRPSVYRLVQFLRVQEGTDETDPYRVLIRDYGFHLCKGRDQVEVLKNVYRRALKRITVEGLHQACITNTLRGVVSSAGVELDRNQRRLLVNQGPRPDVGFEGITSRFLFDGGLFKREKIGRMRMPLGLDA